MVGNPDAPAAAAAMADSVPGDCQSHTKASRVLSEETKDIQEAHTISPASAEMSEEFAAASSTSSSSEENDSCHQVQHADDSTDATSSEDSNQGSDSVDSFKAGDHVYVWCHAGAYQHHGIVLQVDHVSNKVLIADFTNMGGDNGDASKKKKGVGRLSSFQSSSSDSSESEAASRSFSGLPGGFRMVQEDMISNDDSTKKPQKWCKVKYNANPFEVTFWRPGTCSGTTPDPPDQILARVHFLMMHFHLVPPYHLLECNCETVAAWCTTGEWRTRQVSHLLNWTKTTSVLGTGGAYYSAATATTTCATTGVAGWVGATTEISLLAANPLLLPVICVTGVAVGGMALWNSLQTRHRWKVTSTLLNTEFERFWTGPAASGVTLVQIDTQDDETMTVATMASSVDDETAPVGETTSLNCVSA
jgi:hypothetical protein